MTTVPPNGASHTADDASEEARRLHALSSYGILDTPREKMFDDIAELAAEVCEAEIAVINFVADTRQWFKAERGIGKRELPLDVSICRHALLQRGLFVVPDLSVDCRFSGNPLVSAADGPRFYAGALLTTPDGVAIGTVCVLDKRPRPVGLATTQARVLTTLARQVMSELELRRAILERDHEITRARATQERLRDSETRLQLALSAARAVAWEWDLSRQTIRWASVDAARDLAGSDLDESTSFDDWLARIHPEDIERHKIEGAAAVAAGHGRVTFRLLNKGEVRWLQASGEVTSRTPDGSALTMTGITQNITDRMAGEEALREREEQLSAIINQSTAGFAQVDLSGRFTLVNDRYCDIVGRTKEELFAVTMQEITHPDDLPRNLPMFERAVKEGVPYIHEKRYCRPDGSIVWVNNSVSVIRRRSGEPYGVLAVSIDVTERRQAEAKLRESEERLRVAMEAAAMGEWVWDADSDVVTLSDRGAELFGLPANRQLTWTELQKRIDAEDARSAAQAVVQALERRCDYSSEYRVHRSDGRTVWISAVGRPMFDEQGRATGMVGMAQDVTARRAAEDALRTLNETLEQRVAAEVLERSKAEEALRQSQKLESMGQLTGGVAHDFNNLLTPIIGSLDLLHRRRVGDDRLQRLVEGALQSAERAKTLVQRLLAFARRQPLQATAVDLADLVDGMSELVESTLGPRIELLTQIDTELPAVRADQNQLEMAILNLSVNARDAMPTGGQLRIAAVARKVEADEVPGLVAGSYVRLSVSDTGTGMDNATMARAIEPFFSTKGIGKGTGLGLSMVHGLVAQLGGALTIDSRPDDGTQVHLWLPITAALPSAKRHPPSSQTPGVGMILLVEDEDLVRASTASMLAEVGYNVVETSSAEEALSCLAAGLEPTFVVTDHLMPQMTGTELAKIIRDQRPRLPVLIISGYAEDEGIAADLPRLTKPFRQSELIAKLSEIVSQPSRQ